MIKNPLLKQVADAITEKVDPDKRARFNKVVTAGMKILFDPKSHSNMELVKNPQSREDPAGTISKGITGLAWIMYIQSKKTIDVHVLVMAAIVLMAEVMDYAERAFGVQITPEIVAETTKQIMEHLFTKLGVTPDQLNQAIAEGHKEIVDKGMVDQLPEDLRTPEQPVEQVEQQPMEQPV